MKIYVTILSLFLSFAVSGQIKQLKTAKKEVIGKVGNYIKLYTLDETYVIQNSDSKYTQITEYKSGFPQEVAVIRIDLIINSEFQYYFFSKLNSKS